MIQIYKEGGALPYIISKLLRVLRATLTTNYWVLLLFYAAYLRGANYGACKLPFLLVGDNASYTPSMVPG